MSLLQGFAPVNEAQVSSVGDTLEAREVRAVAAFEGALQLAAQGRAAAAQVRSGRCAGTPAPVLTRVVVAVMPQLPPLDRCSPADSLPARCRRRLPRLQAQLRSLLEDPVVIGGATDQLHRLKFLALKNLGDLLARQPGGTGVPDALAVYCQATEVEADDALLWNRMGTLVGGAVGQCPLAGKAGRARVQLPPQPCCCTPLHALLWLHLLRCATSV